MTVKAPRPHETGADDLLRRIWEPLPAWVAQAACRGCNPDLFYPERGASTREAKAVCAGCPVRAECLEQALDDSVKFGVWGGLSEHERRKLRKARHDQRRSA